MIEGESFNELILKKDVYSSNTGEYYPSVPIYRLPLLVETMSNVDKINLAIGTEVENGNKNFFCHRCLTLSVKKELVDELKEVERIILSSNVVSLFKEKVIPHYWDVRFDAKAAITVRKRNCGVEPIVSSDIEDLYQLHYNKDCEFTTDIFLPLLC